MQPEPMTQEEYRKDSELCPVCRSENVQGGDIEVDSNGALQYCECLSCHATWTDVYELKGYALD
jgi:formate dehydrogenase maturation protein FdhE